MRIIEDVCPHFPAGVPSGHICDAKYVLVGEAGGKWEDRARRPFVGPSGELLNTIWKASGLTRRDIYITNVVPYRPPNNDISSVKPSELTYFVQELNARLRTRLSSPRVIVPTGNTAFSAITGITPRYHGEPLITKWRGSILSVPWKDGKDVKVVGTIHPASVLRTPTLLKTSIYDWQRIKEEGKRDTPIPVRERDTKPSAATKRNFLNFIKENPHVPISIDIETSRTSIICIGFAVSADYGMSVSFDATELSFIREVCESANPKVGQNFLFDNFWLAREGVYVRNVKWDVGNMFHALDPNAGPATTSKDPNDPNAGKSRIKPYSLAYLTSIFTRQPYYKDEAKDDGGWIKVDGDRSKLERLMAYNCLDVMVTWELQQTLEVKLREAGKLDLYLNHYAALYTPILECMLHGVRFNVGDAEKTYAQLSSKCQALQGEVAEKAGIPLHSTKVYKRKPKDFPYELDEESGTWKPLPMGVLSDFMAPEPASRIFGSPYVRHVGKSISNAKLQDFLYRILKLPKRTKKGKTTTDAAALRGLRLAHPEHGEILDKVLDFRRMEKVASFLKEGKCDADGRLRCQYKMTVQTGRLSSSENPMGTGCNLQNFDRELRHLVLPDEFEVPE